MLWSVNLFVWRAVYKPYNAFKNFFQNWYKWQWLTSFSWPEQQKRHLVFGAVQRISLCLEVKADSVTKVILFPMFVHFCINFSILFPSKIRHSEWIRCNSNNFLEIIEMEAAYLILCLFTYLNTFAGSDVKILAAKIPPAQIVHPLYVGMSILLHVWRSTLCLFRRAEFMFPRSQKHFFLLVNKRKIITSLSWLINQ